MLLTLQMLRERRQGVRARFVGGEALGPAGEHITAMLDATCELGMAVYA